MAEKAGLQAYSGIHGMGREVTGGYASDLLSDVLAHAREGNVWITVQTHKNILAVASLKKLAAVLIVKNLRPSAEVIAISNAQKIPILCTDKETFEVAGELFRLLNAH